MSERSHLRALLVDDDTDFRDSLATLVEREGFDVRGAASLAEARKLMAEEEPDVVLADLQLPDGDGLELLRDEELCARCDIIVITGNASFESAVDALRQGATDYLTKPVDRGRLKTILANVLRTRSLKEEVRHLRDDLRELGRFGRMVGRSPAMQKVYDLIERVAPTSASVLITGESGTGKELVAETIHLLSKRRQKPFLAVNAGALQPNLIESELFGHEKGAFTGADRVRRGHFEEVNHGTLFLDEVIEMPVELQVKLLRVLETGTVIRVGSSEGLPVDVRLIAASNRDPQRAVKESQLREDLYYRLNVFPIALPPLRDRGEDIEFLAEHFLSEVNEREATRKRWSRRALTKLASYPWPGNVRELKNTVERAAILADEEIGEDLLPSGGAAVPASGDGPSLHVRVGTSLAETERRLILATLREVNGDKKRAAEILGISVKTIYNRLNVYEAAESLVPDTGEE
ncbi:MAG TPA: sigma-54 dependent transcriptional regulator [Candidatus Eisenbacteria bacterium]|jgi:DNA-binding NtrC family response regulator|nr:sigma-54 dependent transcriptional regulator [Candidatus Eisenbacteria bacterium]